MSKLSDWIRMRVLIAKAKLLKVLNSKIIQSIISFDITFVFLFLALKLIGYEWSLINLIGCFGLWILTKELFKYIRTVASELRQK